MTMATVPLKLLLSFYPSRRLGGLTTGEWFMAIVVKFLSQPEAGGSDD